MPHFIQEIVGEIVHNTTKPTTTRKYLGDI